MIFPVDILVRRVEGGAKSGIIESLIPFPNSATKEI